MTATASALPPPRSDAPQAPLGVRPLHPSPGAATPDEVPPPALSVDAERAVETKTAAPTPTSPPPSPSWSHTLAASPEAGQHGGNLDRPPSQEQPRTPLPDTSTPEGEVLSFTPGRLDDKVVVRLKEPEGHLDVEVSRHDDGVDVVLTGTREALADTATLRPALDRALSEGGYRLNRFDTQTEPEGGQGQQDAQEAPPDVVFDDDAPGAVASKTHEKTRPKRLLDTFA